MKSFGNELVLFCLLAIGWGTCWVLAIVECLQNCKLFGQELVCQEHSVNYLDRNCIQQEKKKAHIAAFLFKNAAIEKPNVGGFSHVYKRSQKMVYSCVSKNAATGLSLQPHFEKRNYRTETTTTFKNAAIGPDYNCVLNIAQSGSISTFCINATIGSDLQLRLKKCGYRPAGGYCCVE